MAFVLDNYAFRTNIDLIVLTEELCTLVGVLEAVLLSWLLLLLKFLFFLLRADVPLTVQVVQYSKVFDQLFDIWAKVTPARRTGQYVTGSQVHQTMLAKSVTTGQDAWDFLFVIILIKADRTSYFHPVVVTS